MLTLDVGLILPQKGEEVALRLLGHTQAQGCRLLSKFIRHQGAQIIEVECGEECVIFSYDFKLRRRVFGELVRRGRHLVQGWMMRQLNPRLLYLHLNVMSWRLRIQQFMTSQCRGRNTEATISARHVLLWSREGKYGPDPLRVSA